MDVSRIFLKTANSLLSAVIVLFLVVAGAYSAYALWDNMQVYASVDDIQSQLLKYKPTPGEDNGPTFEELRAINPDVPARPILDHHAPPTQRNAAPAPIPLCVFF